MMEQNVKSCLPRGKGRNFKLLNITIRQLREPRTVRLIIWLVYYLNNSSLFIH